jgi:hypothetical protein
VIRGWSAGNKPDDSAARFAAAWVQLPPERQQRLVHEIQAALREVAGTGQADRRPRQQEPRYARHVRFERGGQVQVLNSARQARVDAAWAALDATSREIEHGKGRR